jgi:hypothetical protein
MYVILIWNLGKQKQAHRRNLCVYLHHSSYKNRLQFSGKHNMSLDNNQAVAVMYPKDVFQADSRTRKYLTTT